jgi:hypothetical protein
MGEARFNGMHSQPNAKGINAHGKSVAINPAYHAVEPWLFSNDIELDEVLSLQAQHMLLVPEQPSYPKVNVAALVQQAVTQDPQGQSLHGSTHKKLKHAPANPHEFGV